VEYQSRIFFSQKAALVVAHPGHELRVFHWLERAHPLVFVLTDGSGASGQPRVESTTRLLQQVGACSGCIFGRLTDGDLYQSIIDQNFGLFIRILEELTESLAEEGINYIAGDAIEGYNPTHDVCRLIINAAVEKLRRRDDRSLLNFDFLLAGPPDACPSHLREGALWLSLNDQDFKRKMNAAQSYPDLWPEVANALNVNGPDAFRVECLRPVRDSTQGYILEEPPFYERHGENRVATGVYRQVLRYREHMLPLVEAIRRQVEQAV
jgi:hypothetical protein